MNKNIYISPCIEQVEIVLEQCIASSTPDDGKVSGVTPDPWKEGNTDWW